MEHIKENEWYVGDFTLDCALGNNEKSIENKISIPFFIKNDICYYPINIEENEYIKLPIKLGNKYPFSTGLDKNTQKMVNKAYASYLRDFVHFDLKKEIVIINDIRKTKQDEWKKLKIIHDSWIPYSFSMKNYTPTKSEKDYNSSVYHKKYDNQTSNTEYIWKLVPFVINERDNNSKYGYKTIMIPISFAYNKYEGFTYLDKWKKTYPPTQKGNSKPICYQEVKNYPDVLGLTNDMENSKDLSNKEALEWFITHDLEKISILVETVKEIKKANADYEESKIIYPIKEIFNNNDSIIEIINQINNLLKKYPSVTITVKNYIEEEFKNNNKLDLSSKQIELLLIISLFNLKNTLKDIILLDDNIAMINYENYYSDFITKIEGFYNTNNYEFVEMTFKEQLLLPSYYTSKSYEEYTILLEKMLNTLLEKLKVDNKIYIDELSGNILIPDAILYLNKKLIDLYKAKIKEKDLLIDYIYIEPREYRKPIIKKGTIIQYGKTNDFLIQENIEVLSIKKEEKCKVKRRI